MQHGNSLLFAIAIGVCLFGSEVVAEEPIHGLTNSLILCTSFSSIEKDTCYFVGKSVSKVHFSVSITNTVDCSWILDFITEHLFWWNSDFFRAGPFEFCDMEIGNRISLDGCDVQPSVFSMTPNAATNISLSVYCHDRDLPRIAGLKFRFTATSSERMYLRAARCWEGQLENGVLTDHQKSTEVEREYYEQFSIDPADDEHILAPHPDNVEVLAGPPPA